MRLRNFALLMGSLLIASSGYADKKDRDPCGDFINPGNVIYACAKPDGKLRSVSCPAECRRNEEALEWNMTGPPGVDGADGAPGATGPAGNDGADGAAGSAGADGAPGEPGVTGPAGADGADGADGAPGETGAVGPAGADGTDGTDGSAGPTGADGSDGAAGADGSDGAAGADGLAGADGMDGAEGPMPQLGAKVGKAFEVVYLAETDGFVTAYLQDGESPYGVQRLTGKTDGASPPTTIVAKDGAYGQSDSAAIFFPVKKGEFWLVHTNGNIGMAELSAVFWTPMGN